MRFFRFWYIMFERGKPPGHESNTGEYSMSDMNAMNREAKKRQLRRQVISPNQPRPPVQEENSEEVVKRARRKVLKKRLVILLVAVLLITGAVFGGYQYYRNYRYTEYSVGWERQLERSDASFTGYMDFGSNVLKYTKDGASYVDASGKDVWIQSYEMKSPVASVNGSFAVIADQQGNSIYICDENGLQGVATTLLPILKVTVSAHGVVAAVVEDQTATYINMFRKDGTVLDITIKGLLGGEVGYPLDISLSPDGTKLVGAFMYIDSGVLKSRVAFYDFSEIGKNIPTRFVGGFHEMYDTSMVARVVFMNDVYSCAFADASISFFSSKNAMSPELLVQIPIEEEIRSIFYSDEYAGAIVTSSGGEHDYRLDVYKADGNKVFSEEFSYDYQFADIDGDLIFLYNEDSCRVYNMWGILKYEGEFDFPVSKISAGKLPNTLIVTGPQNMKEIKLQ